MESPVWWVKNDRIGRSRLFLLAFAILCVLGAAVVGWPSWTNALMILVPSVVVFIGDYLFWRVDLRRAKNP
ncbi:hypothetical protein SAMN05216188_11543 [Lentzea xinjiangensis]|uniref:Uncharacterized protein n=1 Tax=Lentzea xinjiangensis TaxID=402600 RepID=A0A1H9RSX1_9PSEU|nr:hypothetical protein [Lentzea xinjiangensis]SER75892.1 hypothetical protein SAMN05216188_11543 [Lentzea xinjiangensis]